MVDLSLSHVKLESIPRILSENLAETRNERFVLEIVGE
jgi:hypothetical protein